MGYGNPFSIVGHEMTHGAQDIVGGLREGFPGLQFGKNVFLPSRQELLPSYVEGQYPRRTFNRDVKISDPNAYYTALREWFAPHYVNPRTTRLASEAAPPVDLNAPEFVRNAEFLKRFLK